MKTPGLFVFLIFTMFCCISCEKAADWPLQSVELNKIVVDGMITNEIKKHEIRLSFPTVQPNQNPIPVSGATIQISSADGIMAFDEDPQRPGVYAARQAFAGKVARTYTLLINYNGNIITSKDIMYPAIDFIFLRYIRHNDTGLFKMSWVTNPYNPNRPAMYEVILDWSDVEGYKNLPDEQTTARLLYYSLPTLDVSQIFAPSAEIVLFPPGTIITERRHSLSPQHADYLRALLSETTWQGGFFNTAAANIPSNISSGNLGFFSCCAVTTKTEIARKLLPIELLSK